MTEVLRPLLARAARGHVSMRRPSVGYAVLSLACMGALFYVSALPGGANVPNTGFWRFAWNASHIPLFACLALCLALAFRQWPVRQRAALTFAVGSAFALLAEWYQGWVPGRRLSLMDIGLDLTGILLVIATFSYWRRL